MNSSARISARLIAVMAIFVFIVCFSPFAVRYANAESEVKVTLHANGGSYSLSEYGVVDSATSVVTFNIDDDGQVSYVNTGVRPEWEGKKHVGWSTDPNAEWPTWYEWFKQPNDDGMYEFALPLDGSVKDLYAVWADEYPVTLNANGGSFGEWYDNDGSHKLETFDVVFWYTENGRAYSSTTFLPDIIPDEDMGDLEHVGWSADKDARRPEYGKDFDRLELNASTPKVLYAVFGDPKAGNIVITPKQTVYNVDITKTSKCRIEYTTKWDGVASPAISTTGWDWVDSPIGSDGKYEYNKILFCTGGDGTDFADTSDAFVADGWLDFDVLNKGTAELLVYADINGKRYRSQTITVNVTDPSSGNGDDSSGQKPDAQEGGDQQKPNAQEGGDQQKPDDPSHQHKYSKWATTKAATEIAAGKQERVCSVCGSKEIREIAQLSPTLKAVKISNPKAAKKSATIKWKKVSKANLKKIKKIEIQYSTDKNFRKNVISKKVSAKKTSYKLTKLKSKKKYYVRIRAYTKKKGVVHVSKWSAKKPFKTK